MRVVIAGAGNVGRSIARELIVNGHQILLIDRDPNAIKPESVPEAEWLLADACEVSSLDEAGLDSCDVAIAATGDDKANLVHSLPSEDRVRGSADGGPGEPPVQRVDVRRAVGRRRRRVDAAADVRARRGGCDGRRPGPAVQLPGRVDEPGRDDAARGLPAGGRPGRGTSTCPATRYRRDHPRRRGAGARNGTPRSRATTSCCSSHRRAARRRWTRYLMPRVEARARSIARGAQATSS